MAGCEYACLSPMQHLSLLGEMENLLQLPRTACPTAGFLLPFEKRIHNPRLRPQRQQRGCPKAKDEVQNATKQHLLSPTAFLHMANAV